jgi:energy-coupling factor transport system permease protein
MIRDITIGQYYQQTSVIHALDPRTKLLWTIIYVISIFFHHNLAGFLLSGAVFFAVASMTKVPLSFMVRGLKSIFMILLFTLCFQIFFTSGTVLFSIGVISITKEGIRSAVFVALRLVLLVLFSSIMTLTTTPNQLADGLEMLCSPLKRLHVPVHEMAMMMSITLRFIPILMEELDKIMKAQQARGADFETGNIIQRVKAMVPVLVPLFVAAFRRADELALAMDARCYHGGDGRTKMKPLRWGRKDAVAMLCGLVYVGLVVVCRRTF